MSVRFILGRSGTGKTRYCIDAITSRLVQPTDNKPLILLVPEQATYQAEQAILADPRIGGYAGGFGGFDSSEKTAQPSFNVLSFDRLQFLLHGRKTIRNGLSRTAEQMIIHRILRDKAAELETFRSSAGSTGLAARLSQIITELLRYAKTPADIDRLLENISNQPGSDLTVLKFADIRLILDEYLKFVEHRFTNSDLELSQTARSVAQAGFLDGIKLWVDGFAGFTTAELVVLMELLKISSAAHVALCLDPSKIDLTNTDIEMLEPLSLFSPVERTYCQLLETIKKCKLKIDEPVILNKPARFAASADLAHVERNLFQLNPDKIAKAADIKIVSAANPRAEAQYVARQIVDLVKNHSLRFRDIAVIAPDIATYRHYITAYFADLGIPLFVDLPRPLSHHGLAELVYSALQTVLNGFSNSDIFSYLKTDLTAIGRDDVDLLENYCIAFGVDGDDWLRSS